MRRVHNSQFEVDPPWCLRPIKLMKQRSHISTFGQHSHQPKKSGIFHRLQPLYDAVEWSRARVALPWSRRLGKRGRETLGGYLRHGWLVTDELLFRRSSRRRITKQPTDTDKCLRLGKTVDVGPDLQNISRQSCDYLTIMPKLRSIYDGRPIYKTSYKRRNAFLRYDSLAKL